MTNRGERRLLWFLTLIVGIGVCMFAFSGQDSPARFVFLPLGIFLTTIAFFQVRRLSPRRYRRFR